MYSFILFQNAMLSRSNKEEDVNYDEIGMDESSEVGK